MDTDKESSEIKYLLNKAFERASENYRKENGTELQLEIEVARFKLFLTIFARD